MLLQLDPIGRIAVLFPSCGLALLVDPHAQECWLVWYGRPLVRRSIPQC